MSVEEKRFITALAGFAAQSDCPDRFHDLRMARLRFVTQPIDQCKWPGVIAVAMALAGAIDDAQKQDIRRAALGRIAAVIIKEHSADLGLIQYPKAPPQPIRQYRDD